MERGLKNILGLALLGLCIACGNKEKEKQSLPEEEHQEAMVRIMTLDPGHFHAALIQKSMYPEVDSTVYVFAPKGPEVDDFLAKIKGYNSREDNPTQWEVVPYFGDDYQERMLADKPGNVMVVAGKNSKKIDYVLAAVKAGLNVYADKPLVINPEGFVKLQEAFAIAEEKGLFIYDIMTERFEATTGMQKLLSRSSEVFGELMEGSPDAPAISKESVHHFYKYVSGSPLVRPAWFFDVNEEGEGLVDVTTHLVDLIQWEAFPGQIIDTADVEMLEAKRWPTELSLDQFSQVTQVQEFPEYLHKDVKDGKLQVYCNGEMIYKIKGKYAKVSVIWNFKAPEGTGDTHYSVMRGTKSDLVIKQGEEEAFKPTLYIKAKQIEGFQKSLDNTMEELVSKSFPGTTIEQLAEDTWKVNIPDRFKVGHEAHFAQVTQNYLSYLRAGKLPDWEVPNMIAKYYTTTRAYQKAFE